MVNTKIPPMLSKNMLIKIFCGCIFYLNKVDINKIDCIPKKYLLSQYWRIIYY